MISTQIVEIKWSQNYQFFCFFAFGLPKTNRIYLYILGSVYYSIPKYQYLSIRQFIDKHWYLGMLSNHFNGKILQISLKYLVYRLAIHNYKPFIIFVLDIWRNVFTNKLFVHLSIWLVGKILHTHTHTHTKIWRYKSLYHTDIDKNKKQLSPRYIKLNRKVYINEVDITSGNDT